MTKYLLLLLTIAICVGCKSEDYARKQLRKNLHEFRVNYQSLKYCPLDSVTYYERRYKKALKKALYYGRIIYPNDSLFSQNRTIIKP